jgi:hypothetical protein
MHQALFKDGCGPCPQGVYYLAAHPSLDCIVLAIIKKDVQVVSNKFV